MLNLSRQIKNIVLGVFLISSIQAYCQTKKVYLYHSDSTKTHVKIEYHVRSNSPNTKEGEYTEFYLTGEVKVKGVFRNNKPSGTWHYYYENENLKMQANFSSSGQSLWKYYYESGTLKKEGVVENGNKNGQWHFYYENGKTKTKGLYKNGTKDGLWKTYFEDDVLKASSLYQNGKGIYKEFYSDGTLKVKGYLRNNHSEGVWEYYYPNGTLQAKGLEIGGIKNGYWEYLYENGNLKSKGDYIDGKQAGEWTYYHNNGEVSSLGNHTNGKKDGHWKLYHEDGKFKGDGKYKLGDGHYTEYYDKGSLKVDGEVKNEKNHGLWKYYYEDGTLEGKCVFEEGEGQYVGFYANGSKKTEGKIKDGNKIGDWVLFDEEGNIIGHLITLYDENDVPIYKDNHDVTVMDSSQVEKEEIVVNDSVPDHVLPHYKYKVRGKWKKNIRYFHPVNNHEFKGLIVSSNPLALINGELPVYLEYYYQERLGYQLSYNIIRRPFFQKVSNLESGSVITRGYSVDIAQKFYSRSSDLGMVYFAHQFRYRDLRYNVSIADTLHTGNVLTAVARERAYEYVVMVGNRILQNLDYDGYTFDIYLGLGIGYRDFKESEYHEEQLNNAFDELSKGDIYMPFRFGFSFGYTFQR